PSMSTTMSGVETVSRMFELAAAGNFDDALALLHDDFVAREPPGLPYSGEHHGPAAFRDLITHITGLMDIAFESIDFADAGDTVVMEVTGRFTSRASGRSVVMDFIEVFTLRDGKIAEDDIYYKDPGAI